MIYTKPTVFLSKFIKNFPRPISRTIVNSKNDKVLIRLTNYRLKALFQVLLNIINGKNNRNFRILNRNIQITQH